jgi:hypothetical protein
MYLIGLNEPLDGGSFKSLVTVWDYGFTRWVEMIGKCSLLVGGSSLNALLLGISWKP